MKPTREHATNNSQTYFVGSETWGRIAKFRAEPWARLFIDTLYRYRCSAYLLHEFVVMPEHFHLIITPNCALERAVQYIKGGFSHQVKHELGSNSEVWQRGFTDHRIRDAEDYDKHFHYLRLNPVRAGLCSQPEHYPYSSAFPGFELDDVPEGFRFQPAVRKASLSG